MFHVTESPRGSGRPWPDYQHPSLSRWGARFVAITSLLKLYLCRGLDVLTLVRLCRDGSKPADAFLSPALL